METFLTRFLDLTGIFLNFLLLWFCAETNNNWEESNAVPKPFGGGGGIFNQAKNVLSLGFDVVDVDVIAT